MPTPSMLKLQARKVLFSEERRLKPLGSMTTRISTQVFMLMAGPALLMPTEASMDYLTVLMPMSGVLRLVDLRRMLLLSLIKLLEFSLRRRRRLLPKRRRRQLLVVLQLQPKEVEEQAACKRSSLSMLTARKWMERLSPRWPKTARSLTRNAQTRTSILSLPEIRRELHVRLPSSNSLRPSQSALQSVERTWPL